jgi:hypothetical protein
VLPLLGLEPERPINKQRPAVSDSGLYYAYVRAGSGGWRIKIEDQDGATLYEEQTEFVPHLNVYWIWGPQDQLWLYNSDDGRVHCWTRQEDATWRHVQWGYGRVCETEEDVGVPPESLYPDYET